jgi:homoserine kinase
MASSKQLTVNSTAQILVESYGENRFVRLHNDDSHPCFLGGSNVSSTNGFKFDKNTTIDLNVPPKSVIYAATASPNTTTVSVLYLVP